jgi:hypothetical protein
MFFFLSFVEKICCHRSKRKQFDSFGFKKEVRVLLEVLEKQVWKKFF